ncbi:MAG: hypothetical protein U5M51_06390 [Emticicia sp.]|nr:hypothetical protein [Emticicia sp.]
MFSSCNYLNPKPESSQQSLDYTEAKNEKNKFDNYGVLHNQTLEYLGKEFGTNLNKTSLPEVKLKLNEFAKNLGYNLNDADCVLIEQLKGCEKKGSLGFKPGGCIQDPYCILFPKKCDFFDWLFKSWTDETIKDASKIRLFIAECKIKEEEILNDTNLTSREKDNGLKAISVARYSSVYWFNQNINLSTSVWFSDPTVLNPQGLCWYCVVGVDALGGALGGPFGAGLASGIYIGSK